MDGDGGANALGGCGHFIMLPLLGCLAFSCSMMVSIVGSVPFDRTVSRLRVLAYVYQSFCFFELPFPFSINFVGCYVELGFWTFRAYYFD